MHICIYFSSQSSTPKKSSGKVIARNHDSFQDFEKKTIDAWDEGDDDLMNMKELRTSLPTTDEASLHVHVDALHRHSGSRIPDISDDAHARVRSGLRSKYSNDLTFTGLGLKNSKDLTISSADDNCPSSNKSSRSYLSPSAYQINSVSGKNATWHNTQIVLTLRTSKAGIPGLRKLPCGVRSRYAGSTVCQRQASEVGIPALFSDSYWHLNTWVVEIQARQQLKNIFPHETQRIFVKFLLHFDT